MEQKKILYIINKKSGAEENSHIVDLIKRTMESNGINYLIFELTGHNDSVEITMLIKSFNPKQIVAGGGDGTINLVASLILNQNYELGILPLGSANGLAFELNIPEQVEEALALIINGTAKPMDLVRINDNHISLHLCDLGINARIVKEFEKEGKRGFMGYFKHFFKELLRTKKRFKCQVRIKDNVYKHKAYMTIIANSSSYRTGANMNPLGKKDDGKFEIIILKPYKRWIWRSFIGAFTGTLNKQPHVVTYVCETAQISVFPFQDLQIDGESLGKHGQLHAKIQKHALNVIMN